MRFYESNGIMYICTKDLSAPTQTDPKLSGFKVLMVVEG